MEVTDKEIDSSVSESDGEGLSRLEKELKTWRGYRHELHKLRPLWDGDEIPVIRLLQRGSVESPGPSVKPGFLEILCQAGDDCLASPSPNRAGKTKGYRLALAEWLTDPEHPLTARVVVNRIWQHHFGTGIVPTADNFGRYGASPSHPELLDWLAVDFVNHGWKVKRLHKLIMLSSVYQQSSRRTDNRSAELAEGKDPENRLLWRRPLRRLEAEALRDSILSVAGRLDLTANGPPVMLDARPDGLQLPVTDGANRRSVYLLARRTWSSTFMTTFDFPNIDTTCAKRVPSASPLQSLTMMNSEFVTENASAVARLAMERAQGSADSFEPIIRAGYGIVLSREPTPTEIDLAANHLERSERYSPGKQRGRRGARAVRRELRANAVEFERVPLRRLRACHADRRAVLTDQDRSIAQPERSKLGTASCSPFFSDDWCATIPGTVIAKDSYTSITGSRSSMRALTNSAARNGWLPSWPLPCRIGAGSMSLFQ